jgi:hypothetical protein
MADYRRPRGNLLPIVTHVVLLTLYAGMSYPAWGGTMGASTRKKEQDQREALADLDVMFPDDLLTIRQLCAVNHESGAIARTSKLGINLPSVPTYCRAAIDASARRNLSIDLYMGLALKDQIGTDDVITKDDYDKLAHGEAGRIYANIFDAAKGGQTTYPGLTGTPRPLTPSLAYDTGHDFGQFEPAKVPVMSDAAELESTADACFNEKDQITPLPVNGKPTARTRACLVAGANIGKRLAHVAMDTTGATDTTGSIGKPATPPVPTPAPRPASPSGKQASATAIGG